MINDYFISIRAQIEKFHYIIHDFSIEEKVYSEDKGFISGKITFTNSSILEFGEVKDITIRDKIKYRYHYMNSDGAIIFRYDNAKHHPEIETFPHHKHLPDKVKISKEVNLSEMLMEVEEIILRNSSG